MHIAQPPKTGSERSYGVQSDDSDRVAVTAYVGLLSSLSMILLSMLCSASFSEEPHI